MSKCKGFTLVELMVSISILAISLSIAIPNLSVFIVKLRVDNEISELFRLLLSARNAAINANQNVTVCPLNDASQCNTDWQGQISVFIDTNNNKILDIANNEFVIRSKANIKSGDLLVYGKKRDSIIYQPTGRLSGLSNGTFRYCPQEHSSLSRGIIIAQSGRLYASSDLNNNGIDENRSSVEIKCD